jgi:uncharacterized membrane protein
MALLALVQGDSGSDRIDGILHVIEYVALAVEILAVVVIVVAIARATVRYVEARLGHGDAKAAYHGYRAEIGSGLLLGLEILVAADVIRTVVLEPTLESVGVLGILVVVRIVLGWSLVVEIEHRWPWQEPNDDASM